MLLVGSSVLSYGDALHTVGEHALALTPSVLEYVPLLDSLRRILAEPIHADRDQPPFARSTRDGFALHSADLLSNAQLTIIGRLRAGEAWNGLPLATGQAIEIMTGAPVPAGADCVLMVEHATVEAAAGTLSVTSSRSLLPGENIVPAGAEARAGDTLVHPGVRVGPQHIALAAACGYATVTVHAQPRVGVLATGDELVPINHQPLPFQIRNSNSYSLAAQISRCGGIPIIHPPAHDSLEASQSGICAALDCDLLILSGGVSMGKYDFVEQALAKLGAEFFFTGARIQPGRPIVFGQLPTPSGKKLPFFGLPGNPVSTLVTFTLFAAPILGALAGQTNPGPHFAQARLSQLVEARSGLTRFLPAYLESNVTGATIRPIPWHGSGDQSAAAKTNCFLVVPEDIAYAAGDVATLLQL